MTSVAMADIPAQAEDESHRIARMRFGGGVDDRIGLYFGQMEIKTIMHRSPSRYEWSAPADHDLPVAPSSRLVPGVRRPVTARRR